MPETPATDQTTPQPSARIRSIDALRGFDMLCITGGMAFVATILPFFGNAVQKTIAPQLEHVAWEGFHFCDLIFPLFLFLVGMTTVFSLNKLIAQRGNGAAYVRLVRRAILLYVLGIIFSGGLANRWPDIRLMGVLQRIGICYLFTGILFINFRPRTLFIIMLALLIGYWAFLAYVPVPELGAPSFERGKNWANYIDSRFLPGKKYDGQWDPEGYLSTLPAVATCLLGVFAALILRGREMSEKLRIAILVGIGALCLGLGYAWGYPSPVQCPIIKKIWTSSYVLVSAGYSFLLLALFYTVIDVWKFSVWSIPFIWVGANAITIYLAHGVIDFDGIANRLAGGDIRALFPQQVGDALISGVSLALVLALMWLLHRYKMFLRV